MPTLIFERTGFPIDLPEGGRVVDVCDEHPRAGIPFSCRDANCGTCRVEIREGIELCTAPGPAETSLLQYLNAGPSMRLACQMALRAGPGLVKLRVTL